MNLGDIFKELKVDSWYKVIMVTGIIGLVLSFTVEVKVLTNQQLALLSGGMALAGLGVWQSTHQKIEFREMFQITTPVFGFNAVGWLFLVLGLAMLTIFATDLFGINLLAQLGIIAPTPQATATAVSTP